MKKKIVCLLVVLALALCSVGFVACNKGNDDNTASNSDTIGTVAAVAANMLSAGSSSEAASASDEGTQGKNGLNLEFATGVSFPSTIATSMSAAYEGAVSAAVNMSAGYFEAFVNDNSVKVEKVDSDKEGYAIEYKVSVTDSNKDTAVYYLYMNATVTKDGSAVETADINTKDETLAIAGKLVIGTSEFNFDCNAKIVNDVQHFVFEVAVGASNNISLEAYSKTSGNICVDFNVNLDVFGLVGATAKVSAEIGNLGNNVYGVDAEVEVSATVLTFAVKADANIELSAKSTDDTATVFNINGSAGVEVTIPVIGTYDVDATISGTATKPADNGDITFSATATVTACKLEQNND